MLLEEYDEAFHISNEKEISYQDGFADGVKEQKHSDEEIAAALHLSLEQVKECLPATI